VDAQQECLALPVALEHLLQYMASVHLLGLAAGQIEKQGLSKSDIASYLSGLKDKRARIFGSAGLDRRLGDREATLTSLARADDLIAEVTTKLRHNLVKTQEQDPESCALPVELATPLHYDILSDLRRRRVSGYARVLKAKRRLRQLDGIVSDHLRDMIATEVSRINLRMQWIVLVLSIPALLLTFFSLIAETLPEPRKMALWASLSSERQETLDPNAQEGSTLKPIGSSNQAAVPEDSTGLRSLPSAKVEPIGAQGSVPESSMARSH
jgi:hypothetical protein